MPNKTNKAILGVSVVSFNFIKLLNEHTTGSNWHEVQGPSSGCGLDYWYEGRDGDGNIIEAYINVDQGYCTVSVDEETIFEGDIMGTKYAK